MKLQFKKVGIDFAIFDVNTCRGAPMGRSSGVWTRNVRNDDRMEMTPYYDDLPFKLYLQKVPFIDGAYDRGGVYWGSPNNLYVAYCHAWIDELDREFEVNVYVRASSREAAKVSVLAELPNATFYR